jgi:SAM-dependent methyltransferase
MTAPDRSIVRKLASDALARGDSTGWFEQLYARAAADPAQIPWADLCPNPSLVAWLDRDQPVGRGQRALVVGCGLGDDAEELARRGYRVTAFDISPAAIAWCRRRFPDSAVEYQTVDAMQPPARWRQQFDLIVEIYTLQALPPAPRAQAAAGIAACLAAGGTLLVIARGRDAADDPGAMPWPLTRDDFAPLAAAGLVTERFEDYFDREDPPARRFRVTLRRP